MLGFPTANIQVTKETAASTEAVLKDGINHVFFGWGVVEGSLEKTACGEGCNVFPVVMSVGYNPHFKDVHTLAIEAHYLHTFKEDFYGSVVRVAVMGEIREMGAFTTLEALIEVIRSDCVEAGKRLALLGEWKSCAFFKGSDDTATVRALGTSPSLLYPLRINSEIEAQIEA